MDKNKLLKNDNNNFKTKDLLKDVIKTSTFKVKLKKNNTKMW
ncbi:hypothetical protein SLITO_v1c05590 [Spiroplasma litorale]|uniref:Uncharacterized protein n=1 Tax=Spiroplasma litorale TaxID=216942 RepID=A0A0K1W266_9MOLU|nr:hypothetical protein [Spiroplasma litorale]AKX34197.1 hypothetical protein SLITO_v1c05590 [Spiroplasma litorale]